MNITDIRSRRGKDILYMIIGTALILGGIPLSIYLVDSYLENLPFPWQSIGDSQIDNATISSEYMAPELIGDRSVFIGSMEDVAHATVDDIDYFRELDTENVINTWNADGNGTDLVFIDDNLEKLDSHPDWPTLHVYQRIYWITEYNITKLRNDDSYHFNYDIDYNGSYTINLMLAQITDTGIINLDKTRTLYSSDLLNGTNTDKISWDPLEILEDQLYLGEGRLIIYIETDEDTYFEPGDLIYYQYDIQKPDSSFIGRTTIFNISLVVISAVLGFIAISSTPWWNPTDPKNPGWIGIQMNRFLKWTSGKLKKKGGK